MYVIVVTFVAVWLMPLGQMVLASVKPNTELLGSPWTIPQHPSLQAFKDAWQVLQVERYFKNSVIITTTSAFLVLVIGSLAAYGFSIQHFHGQRVLYPVVLACMILPAQILLVPLYQLLQHVHLINTYAGLILVHMTWQLPFGIFLLSNFFREIPSEILAAARCDGCSEFGIYWRIVMPLSLPSLATLGIFSSTWIWNDFLFGLVFAQEQAIKPVTVGLMATEERYVVSYNLQSAAGLFAVIVPVIIFVAFQRYFIKGLSAGALKG
jgi:multiple sugar transport system permease protein